MESVTLKNPRPEEVGIRVVNAANRGYDVLIESDGGWVVTMRFMIRLNDSARKG